MPPSTSVTPKLGKRTQSQGPHRRFRRLSIRTRELVATHLGMFGLIGAWVALAYPRAAILVVPVLAAATLAELAPQAWRKRYTTEIIQITVIAATLAWARYLDHPFDSHEAFAGWMRLLLGFWILVPVRPGMLRWLVGLIAAELLLLDADGLTRGVSAQVAAPALTGLAILALACDAHLRGRCSKREGVIVGHTRQARAWRWLLLVGSSV